MLFTSGQSDGFLMVFSLQQFRGCSCNENEEKNEKKYEQRIAELKKKLEVKLYL